MNKSDVLMIKQYNSSCWECAI